MQTTINKLCVISDSYPYKKDNSCVFVRDLIVEIAKSKIKCIVITPERIKLRKKKRPYHYMDESRGGNIISVYSPRFISLSSRGILIKATSYFHKKAVLRVLKKEMISPDVLYGHFIYQCGLTAIETARILKCKSVVVCGESTGRLEKGSRPYATGLKLCKWKEKLSSANEIISVSSENLRILRELNYIDNIVSTHVIPNSVNTDIFRKIDRTESRKKLGWNEADFIIIFVGHFIQRKGPDRVDLAASKIKGVRTAFIGAGSFEPKSDCLFCGTVQHDDLPKYLCAADAFVLPTTGEGCCNAIIEAICCGLPIISSNSKFNDDILDDSFSIRIDPNNVEEIMNAILVLKNDLELRKRMSSAALEISGRFSLENRAKKIVEILNK